MLTELAFLKLAVGTRRERRVKKEGSEDIPTEFEIDPGDFVIIDYEQHPVAKRYLPLNEIITINTGSVPIKVLYNQKEYDADVVPAGAVIKAEKNVRTLKIINLDDSNKAKGIVRAKKKPMDINDAIRSLIP